ncbi:MAG: hypothetical protein CMJ18_06240 [Phycisphaeraceae bacterium]|nr:hypothetical protein [Phycisphaeraceae bacterium]
MTDTPYSTSPRSPATRAVAAAAVFVASLLPWLISSDVPKLIARQREVLMGRYSVDWMTTLIILTLIMWGIAFGIARPSKPSGRQRVFRIATAVVATVITLAATDVLCRMIQSPRYIEHTVQQRTSWPGDRVKDVIRRRPADIHYEITYTDQPEHRRSYPGAPPGFGTVRIDLTTDHRGYRNQHRLDDYDVVVLGDSFAEGSRVDDKEPWPVLLAARTGRTVYNLGISGGSPRYYLAALRNHGLALQPETIICMIYEGNDFRTRRTKTSASDRSWWDRIWDSPIRGSLKGAMIRLLGGLNADRDVPHTEGLSWIPVEVPAESSVFYAFPPKRLTRLDYDPQRFPSSRRWRDTARELEQIIDLCREKGIDLHFAYAPSKPHVIMPLVRDRVAAAALHAFVAFKKDDLPPPPEYKERFYARIDTLEHTLSAFCREKDVGFINPTSALRGAMAEGRQVYYSYDQHWTSIGHEVVVDVMLEHLDRHASGH